jgi:hypothetical protein
MPVQHELIKASSAILTIFSVPQVPYWTSLHGDNKGEYRIPCPKVPHQLDKACIALDLSKNNTDTHPIKSSQPTK